MAISATSCILTANEWQYAKDIKPGDWVFNHRGEPVKVKTTQIYRSEDCYRVLFDDALSLDGDSHLTLPLEDPHYRKRATAYRGMRKRRAQLKLKSLQDLQELDLTYRGNRLTYSVPTTEPIQLPHQPLAIPPFIYGLWFFGRIRRRQIKVAHEFAENAYQQLKDAGYQVEKTGEWMGAYQRFRTTPSIWDQLRGLQTHSIPLQYLNGSPDQRLALFQGILSTKPCKKAGQSGIFVLKTRKKHINTIYQYLTESLGAKTQLYFNKYTNSYELRISRITPFLPQMGPDRPTPHLARRYVKSIERIPAQLCVHIETDEENGTFLVGEGFIPCQ